MNCLVGSLFLVSLFFLHDHLISLFSDLPFSLWYSSSLCCNVFHSQTETVQLGKLFVPAKRPKLFCQVVHLFFKFQWYLAALFANVPSFDTALLNVTINKDFFSCF